MAATADVVIIGAGAYGASVAYHLVKMGMTHVVLVDKHQAVSQTTLRAAGLSSEVQHTPFLTRVASTSVRMIERFQEETGEAFTSYQPGSLKIARNADDAQRLRHEVAVARDNGVNVDVISSAEAARLSPLLETESIEAVSHAPMDVYFEPEELPCAYLRAATRLGLTVLPDRMVRAIRWQSGKSHDGVVQAVVTDEGEIETPLVVDAAGAWSSLVGDLVEVDIPIVPVLHQLLVTEPIAEIKPEHPIVRIMDVNAYIRPCQGGLILGGYEPAPRLFDAREIQADMDVAELDVDADILHAIRAKICDVLPIFREIKIAELRGGLPTITADGHPLLGPLPGMTGFFVLSGCNVGGLSKSPALGHALAHWIVTGSPDQDLSPAAPDRFAGRFSSAEEYQDACGWQYSHHYRKAE